MLLAAALTLLAAPPVLAQPAVDPSGHWEGALQAPTMEVPFAVDFAKDEHGRIAGTVSLPAERIKGLPLLTVDIDGRSITFSARADQPLSGTLSPDGRTIAGDYSAAGTTVPFVLTRVGDATVTPPAASPTASAALEGTWNAVIAANGVEARVVLTVANRSDGTATAYIVNLDQGGLRLPLVAAQNGAAVTLTSTVVPSSFAGTINAAGEIAGTFTQGTLSVPVTFRRAANNR
jgi:hypothetical protein